jgi:hypothetical protein
LYGAGCYRPGGCADIIQAVAERIDARQFNPLFPQPFPRFIQHAIWRYYSQSGLDVCNGNRINDARRCTKMDCRVRLMCDRVVLRKAVESYPIIGWSEQFCSDSAWSVRAQSFISLKSEERQMRINWEVVKPSLWTGAGGVVVGMLLLSYGFGFMSRTTADKLASTSSERAVIAVLAPVCAANFRALPDVAARTASLVADKDNPYKMREAFPATMITLPGKSYPDSDLTAACAGLILAPPKTAELKQ